MDLMCALSFGQLGNPYWRATEMQRIRQLRFGIAGTEIPKQRLGLLAQVLEIRMGGQRLRHDASMGPVSA